MKTLILTFGLILISLNAFPQENSDLQNPKNQFGFYCYPGFVKMIGYKEYEGTVSIKVEGTVAYGFKYLRSISSNLSIDAGVSYAEYSEINHFVDETGNIDDYLNESFRTFTFPIILKKYYNNNFYLGAGTIIDYTLSRRNTYVLTDTQSGFGISISAGKEIFIKNFSIEIAPKIDLHSVIPFSSDLFQQKLLVLGVKLGLNYKIN